MRQQCVGEIQTTEISNFLKSYFYKQTNVRAKGRVPIIKMEIEDGICHGGGGVSRGSRVPHTYFEKLFFVKNHLESFPDCENVFCT